MHVVIVGGGLSGATLAAALTARGIDFDLIERAPALTPAGAGIALMPPALGIAERLGLGDAVRAASCTLPVFRWLTKRGNPISEVEYAALWQGREVRSIHRHRLQEALLSGVSKERLTLGDAVVEVRESATQVEVRTQSGRTFCVDLVVGADGIHSKLRCDHFDGAPPRFLGTNYWRTALACENLVDSYTTMVATGRALGLAPLGFGRTHFFAQQLSDEPLVDPVDGRVERLRRAFGDFTDAGAAALSALSSDRELHFGCGYEAASLERPWNGRRLVLIGDAAHASAPTLGLWGAMAMEDAWVLADELARAPLSDALSAFCRRRSPRVRWVEERTRLWVERMRAADAAVDPTAVYRDDYAPLLAEP